MAETTTTTTNSEPTSVPTYVQTLQTIPKQKFLFGPSPIQFLPRLSRELDASGQIRIAAKREDCNSGLAYGGNKVRKLEFLVADAIRKGCTHVVSVGGIQSNHTRAVTATAVAAGLKAVTVQENWVPIDPPLYRQTGNILLSRIMGGHVRLDLPCRGFDVGHEEALRQAIRELTAADPTAKPYWIPAGASDHELGGLGFVNFVLELAEQEAESGVFFDPLIVCTVTGSSHAGLVVGAVAEGKGRHVIGIDASGNAAATRAQVTRIARATAKRLDPALEIPDEAIVLDERFHEGAYGIPGPTTIAAIRLAAQTEAMITDPVYEGKSMAGLIQLVREGSIQPGSHVLYVHLGGQPALNAYSGYFDADDERGEEAVKGMGDEE